MALISCKSSGGKKESLSPSAGSQPFAGSSTPSVWADSSLPLSLNYSLDFTNEDRGFMQDMLTEWDDAVQDHTMFAAPLLISNKDNGDLDSYRDAVMGIYLSNNWYAEISSNALAITQYFGSLKNSGTSSEYVQITHADIMINYRDFSFSNSPTPGQYDLPSVVLHEVGHFLGLSHESVYENSVMRPFLGSADLERTLYLKDITNIQNNYDEEASSTSAVMAFSSGSSSSSNHEHDDDGGSLGIPDIPVRGIIELRKDGICVHKLNDEVVDFHYTESFFSELGFDL